MQGSVIELASPVKLLNHLREQLLPLLRVNLALVACNHTTLRIDKNQRGPRVYRVLPPEVHAAIVDHWMPDSIAQDRVAHALGKLLAGKFRRMNAYNAEFIRKSVL